MLQQPDQSSQSYWTFDTEGEQDAQVGSEAGSSAQPPLVVEAEAQQGDAGVAWQIPAASPPSTAAAPQVLSPPPFQPGRTRRRHPLLKTLLALLAVVLLGVAGSVSGFQVSRVVSHRGQVGTSPTAGLGRIPTAPPRQTPAATPTTRPSASPTPRPTTLVPSPTPQAVILAQDNFQRPNQALWGTASDGSVWGGDANASPAFSIVDGTGQVAGGQGFFNAILGPRVENSEVVYIGSVSRFDNLRDNIGAVLRWTDGNHYYKAYLDGASLILIKRVAGVVTRLGAAPFSALNSVSYSLRFRVAGSQLLVRAWPTRGIEPTTWMIAASDNSLASGFGGLRVLVEQGITITVTKFQERSIA